MLRAWKILGTVSFKVLGDNLFLLDFEHEWDKTQVMGERPWLFDANLVTIAEFDGFTPLSQMDFEKAAFWVRMYNLPLVCMGSAIGHQIGSTVGVVEDVEVNDGDVPWGEYLRVRILIDLAKPLDRGRKIMTKNKSTWVAFQYEKIPNFCYNCGVVRHGRKGCVASDSHVEGGLPGESPFGSWLKVIHVFRKWRGGDESKGRWRTNQGQQWRRGRHSCESPAEDSQTGASDDSQSPTLSDPLNEKQNSSMISLIFSDLDIMGRDSRHQMRSRIPEDPLSSDSQEVGSGKVGVVTGLADGVSVNPALGMDNSGMRDMRDTSVGEFKNSLGLILRDEMRVTLASGFVGADLSQDQVGGGPSRFVGSWDSKLGQM